MLLAVAASLHAAPPRAYHLELEANPAAPFPFLGKFGTVTLHVYPAGVRAETFWLNGFSRNGTGAVTVENPLGRMYTDVPLAQISTTLHKLSTSGSKARRRPRSRRYRHRERDPRPPLPPRSTARSLDRRLDDRHASPRIRSSAPSSTNSSAASPPLPPPSINGIRGMPLYVELNFRRYKKLPLVRMKSIAWNARRPR